MLINLGYTIRFILIFLLLLSFNILSFPCKLIFYVQFILYILNFTNVVFYVPLNGNLFWM